MVVGSRSSLEQLALRIIDALDADASTPKEFPRQLAACEADGIEPTNPAYSPSFHLDSDPPFRRKSSRQAFGTRWSLALGVIEAAAIIWAVVKRSS